MATPKTEYQTTVALFASNIEGVLAKIEHSPSCILKSNINVLRTIVSYVSLKLGNQKGGIGKVNKKGLFNLDSELHKVQNFLLQLSVDDSNISTTGNSEENPIARALKLLKILINLSKYRIEYFHDSVFICIDVMNNIGMIEPPLNIPPGAGGSDNAKNAVVNKFMAHCIDDLNLSQNDTLDLNLNFDSADEQDTQRIAAVFKELEDVIQNNIGSLINAADIDKILGQFKKIATSTKVGMLLKQTLKVGEGYLATVDEEILRILYQKNKFSRRVKVDMDRPKSNKILGQGLMGAVVVGNVGSQPAAFKSLNIGSDILGTLKSEARNELMSELRLRWMKHNNENILSLHGVTVVGERLIIAYELMQTDLETVLHHKDKHQVLDPNLGSSISLGISKGLKFLHLNSIIHASLHPGNILLRGVDNYGNLQLNDLRVKLTDFGTQQVKNDLTIAAQVSNPILGLKIKTTRAYLAPEVLTDDKYTYSSDIYALGIISWELGQANVRPFEKISDLATAVATQKHRPSLNQGKFKDWMKEFIEECWNHEPWERPTAQDSQRRIEHEIAFEESQGAGMQDFRGRPLDTVKTDTLKRVALPNGRSSVQRQSGSRLSRVRLSTQKAHVRPSSQARTSVVLQKQRFAFLDDITPDSNSDVGIKILKAMRFYLSDAELQVKGLVGLRIILEAGHREKVVARMGGGLMAIRAIQNHVKEVAVVEPAIGLIGNLSVNEVVSEALMKSGAAQAILSGVVTHIKDEAVVEEALIAFTNLHQGNPARQKFLIQIQAPKAILEILEVHCKSTAILSEGFAAITYLHSGWYGKEVASARLYKANKKSYRGKEGRRLREDFFIMKAYEAILQGIKSFKENRKVQAEGLNALAEIVSGEGFDDRKIKIMKSKFLVPHLAKTMDRHVEHPDVLEACFNLVAELTLVKSSHKEILALEIHESIVVAMKSFTEVEDETLQQSGIRAMYNLCYKDKKASRAMRDAGAIEAAIRAKTLYAQNTDLARTSDQLALVIARGGRI